jgi:hypothetical protein
VLFWQCLFNLGELIMNKLLATLLLTISVSGVAFAEDYDYGYGSRPANGNNGQNPNVIYDTYRSGNNTTYQPKETYKSEYGYNVERYGKPITCTTIGRNTFCN